MDKAEPDREEILDTLEMVYAFHFRFTAAVFFHVPSKNSRGVTIGIPRNGWSESKSSSPLTIQAA